MKPRKKDKTWTIIAIADHGPLASFQVRKSRLRVLVILVAGVLAVTAALLYTQRAETIRAWKSLEYRLEDAESSRDRALAFQRQLKAKIRDLEGALGSVLDDGQPGDDGHYAIDAEARKDALVVENFEVLREPLDGSIRFKFLLRNMDPAGSMVSGFVFVVYRPHFLDTGTWLLFPDVPIVGGMPEDPARGDPFNIARFKTVRGHFSGVRPSGSYYLSVWVLSVEGELLLFRDFFMEA